MAYGDKGRFTRHRNSEPLRKNAFEIRRKAPSVTAPRVNIFGPPAPSSPPPEIPRRYGFVVLIPLVLTLLSWPVFVLSLRHGTTTPSARHIPRPIITEQRAGLRGNDEIKLLSANSDTTREKELLRSNREENDDIMKLSLWLIPPSGDDAEDYDSNKNNNDGSNSNRNPRENSNGRHSVFDRAKNVINKLSAELNGPKFLPHITIVGGIEVRSDFKAMQLAEKLRSGLSGFGPVECSFGDLVLSAPNCWNQALVLEVVPPMDEFQRLCKLSRKLLGMEQPQTDGSVIFPPPLEIPHMSLYYGESPPPPSDVYLSEVFGGQKKSFKGHRVMLWKTDPSAADGVSKWAPLADISIL